jgi:ferredoxin--NADP+ reductase
MSSLLLRVAIIGTGPSGFYAAEQLLKRHSQIEIDLFDRLPTPYGLVRGGVAPDHPKIKAVSRVYEKIASHPAVRFYGHVTIGSDLTRDELLQHYHAVIYAVGAPTDRTLGIPGEELSGSHAATSFVGWYNGHPDHAGRRFDLTQESVAVIGMGNVAVDVVRVLARTIDELRATDIAAHALDALAASRVKDIYMIGRRGPVQGAFTNPELKELGELVGADIEVRKHELELDTASAAELARGEDRLAEKNLHTLREFAAREPGSKAKRIHLRFLRSPIEIHGHGRVEQLTLGINRLVPGSAGDLQAEATGETETLPAGLIFRSVGYRGVGLPGVPLDPRRGTIPHEHGRVQGSSWEYVVGWIKRGPTGVIGTNKPDAVESVEQLLSDFAEGRLNHPAQPSRERLEQRLAARGVAVVTWQDWLRLDALERARGAAIGRPRIKFTSVAEMLAAVDKESKV